MKGSASAALLVLPALCAACGSSAAPSSTPSPSTAGTIEWTLTGSVSDHGSVPAQQCSLLRDPYSGQQAFVVNAVPLPEGPNRPVRDLSAVLVAYHGAGTYSILPNGMTDPTGSASVDFIGQDGAKTASSGSVILNAGVRTGSIHARFDNGDFVVATFNCAT